MNVSLNRAKEAGSVLGVCFLVCRSERVNCTTDYLAPLSRMRVTNRYTALEDLLVLLFDHNPLAFYPPTSIV